MSLPVGTFQPMDGFFVPPTDMAIKDIASAANAVTTEVGLVTQNLVKTSFATNASFQILVFLVQFILTWVVFFNVNSASQINSSGIVSTSVANLVFAILLALVFLAFAITVPQAWQSDAKAPQMLFMLIAVLTLLQSVFVAATTNGLSAGQSNKSSTRGWNLATFVTSIIEICLIGYMLWQFWPYTMDLVNMMPRVIQGVTAGTLAI